MPASSCRRQNGMQYLAETCGGDRLARGPGRATPCGTCASRARHAQPVAPFADYRGRNRLHRPVPARSRAGRGWHGHRLRGRAAGARATARRAQDRQARHGHQGSGDAVHDRAPGARGDGSSVCRESLRRRTHGSRPPLLRDGTGRGRTAARLLRYESTVGDGAGGAVRAHLPGRPARAPEGCRAPRSEAVERPGDGERAEPVAEDHRLWHCQGDRLDWPAGSLELHARRSARWEHRPT